MSALRGNGFISHVALSASGLPLAMIVLPAGPESEGFQALVTQVAAFDGSELARTIADRELGEADACGSELS
jgi:hypothetical protein